MDLDRLYAQASSWWDRMLWLQFQTRSIHREIARVDSSSCEVFPTDLSRDQIGVATI